MSLRLRYGAADELAIDGVESPELVDWSRAPLAPLADPTAAVRGALAAPLDAPPLVERLVPGDHVTIAVDPELPRPDEFVTGTVETLTAAGHSPENLTVLWRPAAEDDSLPLVALPATVRDALQFARHDPTDASQHAYLAATEAGDPIHLHRSLCDADFVIPLGLARAGETLGDAGLFGGLYPTFSTRDARRRLKVSIGRLAEERRGRLRAEADEAGWQLGVQFLVQAISAGGDSVGEVLAGSVETVRAAARRRCDAVWHHPDGRTADLVVAALAGGERQQSWDNVARALWMALRAVNDGGSIALVTRLAARPGSALRRFGRWTEDDPLPKAKKKVDEPDLLAARLLLAARRRARVYLLSDLSERTVESVGAIHLDDPQDVARLVRRHASCLVLGDAQFATLAIDSLEPTP